MTHNPNNKEQLCLWLPEGIDPAEIPGNGERSARIAYLGHVFTTRQYDKGRKYISINSKRVCSKISNKAYANAMAHFANDIEIDHSYSAGFSTKGYRWAKSYRNQPAVRHEFECPRFIQRLNLVDDRAREDYTDLQAELDMVLKKISLPADIEQIVSSIPPKQGVKDETHRINVIRASCHDIQSGRRGLITQSEKTGRIHCQINRLSTYARPHLQLCDEHVAEVDLANSQPYFLATLTDIEPLREAVSQGAFYQLINDQQDSPVNFDDCDQYGSFKKNVLAHLYAQPKHGYDYTASERYTHKGMAEAMEKAFPGIDEFIRGYRAAYGNTALPIAMQRLESDVFISCVLADLYEMKIPAVPIHDAMLCRISDVPLVMKVTFDRLVEMTGITPTLRVSKRVHMGSMPTSSPYIPSSPPTSLCVVGDNEAHLSLSA